MAYRSFVNISSIQQPYFLMNTSEIDTEVRMAVDFEILVREKVRPKSETGPLTVIRDREQFLLWRPAEAEAGRWCHLKTQQDQLSMIRANGNWRPIPWCFIICFLKPDIPQRWGGKYPSEGNSPEVELEFELPSKD